VTKRTALHLGRGLGIEIEYMIVRRDTLDILPVSDEVLRKATGTYANDYETGNMGWSNEFALHVIELKNTSPVPSLKNLPNAFQRQIDRVQQFLKPLGGCLMPAAMHPWMNPRNETRLWNHRYRKIYRTYNRIFDCCRQGWANLQSMHVNISFNGDDEFAQLHAAIRLLMPVIPALAGSSPVAGGKITGLHDTRLSYYRTNQKKIPSIMGKIIPEPVYSEGAYRQRILGKMYRAIAPYDNEGTLQHEWLNSRGAIPRFDRNAIEIRVTDTQECAAADIAVADMIIAVIKQLASERWSDTEAQKKWGVSPLLSIFNDSIKRGENSVIDNSRYLKMFGFPESKARTVELWKHLADCTGKSKTLSPDSLKTVKFILQEGTLSSRIIRSLGKSCSMDQLKDVYGKLCSCLARNDLFIP
jgi:gamma-glutamyl:cysteine ligase YbdK (ATP-grasp superfamily)